MKLRDLLNIGELGLRLLSGEHALDRPVRWVYLTELVETGRYLSGNELVLTGLIGPQLRESPEALVEELVDAGATALGVGLSIQDEVPPRVREACSRSGLPLVEVPRELSFGTISEVVTRRLTAERAAGLATVLGRHRRLISSVAEGSGLRRVFELTRAELGRACWVVSPTGRVIVGPGPDLPEAGRLAAEYLTAARLPHVTDAVDGEPGGSYTLLPVNTRAAHRVAGWFLACEGALVDVPEEGRESAYELAALTALERARLEEGHRVERRLLNALLDQTVTEPTEVAARMRACGLDPERRFVAVACEFGGADDGVAVLRELMPEAAAVTALEGEAVTVVPDGDPGLVERLRASVALLETALVRERLTVGVSAPATGPSLLRGAVEEARHTRRLAAARRAGRAHVVTSDEIHSHALLLATVPDGVRRSFRDRLLGPLQVYDAEHHSDLVRTLSAFLDHSGSWNRCAGELHLHVNTLRYRMRRIEELTGRDLSTLEDRVDFFLALRAM
ncbi:PucR family transcriptional regulator [Actinocorallia aurantiaca]|uniref:PucR family transcriptional regulator ligand-binding domain-containing protein n=1 Tax=Actinocorallia aurantiaca TaxID=46204 RepID=A0ABN3TZZ4_9ACTN